MKTYILIISKYYLKNHPQAGEPTNFKQKLKRGKKKTTIRANIVYWDHIVDQVNKGEAILSIRQWIGKPYKKPGQVEVARCTKLGFKEIFMTHDHALHMTVDDEYLYHPGIEKVAIDDGFENIDGFIDWFAFDMKKNGHFSGAIIEFLEIEFLQETKLLKYEIKQMTYAELLRIWRFGKSENPFLQSEIGQYFAEQMAIKKSKLDHSEQVSISKRIGWSTN